MLQSAAAMFGALFAGTACYAIGTLVAKGTGWREHLSPSEVIPLTALLGAACLHLMMFAIFAMQIAYWPVIVGVPALCIVSAFGWRVEIPCSCDSFFRAS